MARGMDPESRPISVAELLARAKEQGAEDVASAVGSSPAATGGRRRRGGKDSVSVAELTGEIPRIPAQPKAAEEAQPKADQEAQPKAAEEAQPKAAEEAQPKADQESQPKAAGESQPKADQEAQPKAAGESQPADDEKSHPATDESRSGEASSTAPNRATPPPTRDFSSDDVSKRTAAATGATGIKPTPGAPDRPAPFRRSPANAGASDSSAPVGGSDHGSATAGSATAGSSATAAGDEETTNVIPSMQAYSQVDENRHDDHGVLSAAEREREFERYRNFEDVESGARGASPTSGTKKKKRGLFGFGRKAQADTAADANSDAQRSGPVRSAPVRPDAGDNSDHAVTQLIPKDVDESPAPSVDAPADTSAAPDAPEAPATPETRATPETPETPETPDTPKTSETPDTSEARDVAPETAPEKQAPASPQSTASTQQVPTSAQAPPSTQSAAAAPATERYLRFDTDDAATTGNASTSTTPAAGRERSASAQWLVLIGQVLAGLAVGVALFWGFTELWRWNVIFALILSVAVIFGLVTLVHVVRKSQDLISTLLALGVGLLVTIGPLVLLLIAGD